MTTIEHVARRGDRYADSVTLLQVSKRVAAVEGVHAAMIAMATDLNLEMVLGMGFDVAEVGDADPNVMLIAIRCETDVIDVALAEFDLALTDRPSAPASNGTDSVGPPPRTLAEVIDQHTGLALISTPAEAAVCEAFDAVDAGVSAMIFSDNVPVAFEVALKQRALEQGVLVMGPDAGTAIVGGRGLGFANVVRPGPVGIVAASGTGAQQLTCLLDDAGVGIAHVLGVGGRDLSAEVGGLSSITALQLLDADPSTELIVLLSKPPDDGVVTRLRRVIEQLDTPVVEALVGASQADLTEIASDVAARFGHSLQPPRWLPSNWPPAEACFEEIRGLFAGGTLCDEAMALAAATFGAQATIRSNIPFATVQPLVDGLDTAGHMFVDLGDDAFTRGRPHPMIDQSLRLERLATEASREGSRVVVLDVVLGHGADADPAATLAPAIRAALDGSVGALAVVVSLCGSRGDPQRRDHQAEQLRAAGAGVFASNADAARAAIAMVDRGSGAGQ